jgi:hypothetical protein
MPNAGSQQPAAPLRYLVQQVQAIWGAGMGVPKYWYGVVPRWIRHRTGVSSIPRILGQGSTRAAGHHRTPAQSHTVFDTAGCWTSQSSGDSIFCACSVTCMIMLADCPGCCGILGQGGRGPKSVRKSPLQGRKVCVHADRVWAAPDELELHRRELFASFHASSHDQIMTAPTWRSSGVFTLGTQFGTVPGAMRDIISKDMLMPVQGRTRKCGILTELFEVEREAFLEPCASHSRPL